MRPCLLPCSCQASELDHKLKISERTAATVETIKESAVARNTVAFFNRVGSGVKTATNKVVESERVRGWTGRQSPDGAPPPS